MRKNSKQPLSTVLKPPSEIDATITVRNASVANGLPSDAAKSGAGVDGQIRGEGAESRKLTADATKEYVSAGGYVWLAKYIKALPFWIDDLTRDFGDDLYERMMLDPQVLSCVNVLKTAALADGWDVLPAEDDEEAQPGPDKRKATNFSRQVADFCRRVLSGLDRPLDSVLFEMLDAIAVGCKLAEQVYEFVTDGEDAGKLTLRALKVKPRKSYSFVVDVYFNILGVIGLIPGQGAPVIVEGIIGEPDQIPNLLPREKFAALTWRAHDGDPRGTSSLRPAYNAWWLKQQTWAMHLAYMTRFASPSLIGNTAPEAAATLDAFGNLVYPEATMLASLVQLQNGTAAVFPHGAEVQPLEMRGEGGAFLSAIDLYDRQITKAILMQTLATEEGLHQARAASETHQDILGLAIRSVKSALADMVVKDILTPLVDYNFGAAGVALVPQFSLGETEHQDFAANANAIAQLQRSGYLHYSQYPKIDQELDLPPRDMAAQLAEIEKEQAALNAPAVNPDGSPVPGQSEQSGLSQEASKETARIVARDAAQRVAGRQDNALSGD